ncbi:MAG: shikimate dehydrogenase [Phycisphaerales bacterium]|nr:shikimate dehydrogenase [Phycisphaerales bacterium]
MTFIAIAIPVARTDAVSRALDCARLAKSHGADIVEWRVDTLAQDAGGPAAVARLVAESPLACIVTVRDENEGGSFAGSDDERIAAWQAASAALPACAYIDVELSTYHLRQPIQDAVKRIAHAGERTAQERPRVILSFHDFRGRPAGLSARVAEMWADPGSAIAKVVWTARTVRDNLEAFELLKMRAKPTIALCMGEHGLMSRVLSAKFGGFLTYARADEHGTAPGQPTIHELIEEWNFRAINSRTKVYGVVGYPISQARSPAVHNAWFRAANIDARMFALSVAPMWEAFKATLAEMFGSPLLDFYGAAVTMPHKENAIRFVEEGGGSVEASAKRIGAANTIGRAADGTLFAANTDADAIVVALGGSTVAGKRIIVLGAGGAARAAACGLASAGASVVIANRTVARAKRIAEEFAKADGESPALDVRAMSLSALAKHSFDVVVNCTSVGMQGGEAPDDDPLPDAVKLDDQSIVFDAVHTPAQTPLLRRAAQGGSRCIGGSEMFQAQARLQFKLWTGSLPPSSL